MIPNCTQQKIKLHNKLTSIRFPVAIESPLERDAASVTKPKQTVVTTSCFELGSFHVGRSLVRRTLRCGIQRAFREDLRNVKSRVQLQCIELVRDCVFFSGFVNKMVCLTEKCSCAAFCRRLFCCASKTDSDAGEEIDPAATLVILIK